MRFSVAPGTISKQTGSKVFVVSDKDGFKFFSGSLADATCLVNWLNELESKNILARASDEMLKEFAGKILEARPKSNSELIEYSKRILKAIASPKLK